MTPSTARTPATIRNRFKISPLTVRAQRRGESHPADGDPDVEQPQRDHHAGRLARGHSGREAVSDVEEGEGPEAEEVQLAEQRHEDRRGPLWRQKGEAGGQITPPFYIRIAD